MPHSETLGLPVKSRTLKVVCTQFRPLLFPAIELGGCVPFTNLVAESISSNRPHSQEHMDVVIAVVVMGVRCMDGDIDDHALAGHVRGKIFGESQPLLGVQFGW